MEKLLEISLSRLEKVPLDFRRALFDNVDWKDRLIGIMGVRGTGKTTLLLQYGRLHLPAEISIYLSLDGLFFQQHTLVDVTDHFFKLGYRYFLLDEVHKYPQWSLEIKNLYDQYPHIQIIFTGSSVIELFKGQADISRRAVFYQLPGLSFREFLMLYGGYSVPRYDIATIIKDHIPISRSVIAAVGSPLAYFNKYLEFGYYPYSQENERNYHHKLRNTVNLVLENDLPSVENMKYSSVIKLKSLLHVIAQSVPFKPNISWLSEKVGVKRDTIIHYLALLERAGLLRLLQSSATGVAGMNKPEKVYLDNTNLMYALGEGSIEKGNLRETFFFNQVSTVHRVAYDGTGDFLVDSQFLFEVGGQNKTAKQLGGLENAYIVSDDLETGLGKKIPLWLFGLLY